jgi:hypothetical protein
LRIQYSPFRKSSTYNSYTFLNRFPQGMPLLIHGLVICHRSILPEMPEAAPTSSVCVPPPPSSGEQDDIKLAISCPPDLASEQRRLLLTTRVIPPTEAASISWGGGAITIRRIGRWKITLPLIGCLQFTLWRRISVSEFCPLHPTRSLASDCVCTPCVFCMNSYQRFIQYLYI